MSRRRQHLTNRRLESDFERHDEDAEMGLTQHGWLAHSRREVAAELRGY
jgi:hypothetical protein